MVTAIIFGRWIYGVNGKEQRARRKPFSLTSKVYASITRFGKYVSYKQWPYLSLPRELL